MVTQDIRVLHDAQPNPFRVTLSMSFRMILSIPFRLIQVNTYIVRSYRDVIVVTNIATKRTKKA